MAQGLRSKLKNFRSSHCGSALKNPTSIHEDAGLIPGPAQWLRIWRRGELWCRSAAAAPIPLPWATGAALKDQEKVKMPIHRGLLCARRTRLLFTFIAPPCNVEVTSPRDGKNPELRGHGGSDRVRYTPGSPWLVLFLFIADKVQAVQRWHQVERDEVHRQGASL